MFKNNPLLLYVLFCLIFFVGTSSLYAQTYNQEFERRDKNLKKDKEFYAKMLKELRRGDIVDNPDKINSLLDQLPSFTIYKDNFICTGANLGKTLSTDNADAIFQLSIKQRVTKSKLPWDTHLFITYTQIAFWDIYKKSAPFRELDYNPTLALGKYFISNNRLIGYGTFQFEHQSNGKDSTESRDINAVTVSFNHFFNDNFQWHVKLTAPVVLGLYSKDIFKYRGYCKIGADYKTPNNKFKTSAIFEKRGRWNLDFNVMLEAAYQIGKLDNIFAYVQFYSGYAQGVYNFRKHENYLRAGIVLKSEILTFH
ncbi:MAG: phospholipase A [Bacteroidales bacterium]